MAREIIIRSTLDIIDNFRRVNKKRLEKGLVLCDAVMMGLNIDAARDALEDFKGKGIQERPIHFDSIMSHRRYSTILYRLHRLYTKGRSN